MRDFKQPPVVPYLHLKANFALLHTIGGSTSRPEISKALHDEGRGAVPVTRHLKVQVAVVWNTELQRYAYLIQVFVIKEALKSSHVDTKEWGKKFKLTVIQADFSVIRLLILLIQWGYWGLERSPEKR